MSTQTAPQLKSAIRDGVNLRYLDTGSGDPALVFIHGWTCNYSHWRNQTSAFSPEHRVLALDLRGHGESDKPEQDYNIAGFAADIQWLIDELGLERPVLIGHSMGGVIAADLARKHPEATRAVVLVDAPVVPLGPELRPVAESLIAGLQGPSYKQIAEGFLRQFMFNEVSDPALREEIVESSLKTPQRVMYTALASAFEASATLRGPLPVPSLFIRAATQYASAEQIREHIPTIAIAEIQCAHFVQLFSPDETNRAIRKFLESVPA
jgi:pimeloyl-ACP methyl ester carboxylesterase